MNICVTNLSRETSEDALCYAFSAFGQVRAVSIVADATTGEFKAFISMPVEREARKAIGEMNGKNLHGRIVQAEAQAGTNILRTNDRPRASRVDRGGASRDRRGGGGRDRRGGASRDGRGRARRGRRR